MIKINMVTFLMFHINDGIKITAGRGLDLWQQIKM